MISFEYKGELIELPEFPMISYERPRYTFHIPREGLLFSEEEMWVYLRGDFAVVGITDWAQRIMGDLLYFSPPTVGQEISIDDDMGELESCKAVLELTAPISGKVLEINTALRKDPSLANTEPFRGGWICTMQASALEEEKEALMDFAEYFPLMQKKAEDHND